KSPPAPQVSEKSTGTPVGLFGDLKTRRRLVDSHPGGAPNMRLERVEGADPRELLRALRGAVLGAGPAIALGQAGELPREVPAGTAVVLTTSGSAGVPKSVALSRSALTSSALATAARIGEGHWLLPLSGGYIAGVQVMVRALVAGRDPAILA